MAAGHSDPRLSQERDRGQEPITQELTVIVHKPDTELLERAAATSCSEKAPERAPGQGLQVPSPSAAEAGRGALALPPG